MTLRDKTAMVGVGATPYYKRGESVPQTPMELAGKAMLAALDDAGLTVDDVDGLALYSMGLGGDTSLFAQVMGIPEVRFTVTLTGGGGPRQHGHRPNLQTDLIRRGRYEARRAARRAASAAPRSRGVGLQSKVGRRAVRQ